MPSFRVNLNEETSWWEDHRGAIIFFSGAGVLIVFGGIPWLIGVARIVSWILK